MDFGRLRVSSYSSFCYTSITLLREIQSNFFFHLFFFLGFQGKRLKCCSVNFSDFHPECFPIRLPDDDPVHGKRGEKCQEYARSGTAPRIGCTLGQLRLHVICQYYLEVLSRALGRNYVMSVHRTSLSRPSESCFLCQRPKVSSVSGDRPS